MSDIHVPPELIQEAELKVGEVRTAFQTALDSAKIAVESCGWTGKAAAAFNNRFAEASGQFNDVMEQITGIAKMLAAGRDGLVTADEQLATGMTSGP